MTRDDLIASILGASSPKPIEINVDGIGVVWAKVMTAYDSDQLRKKLETLKKDDGCDSGRLLACLLCDAEGKVLFDPADAEAVLSLAKLPTKANSQIIDAATAANSGPKS